MLIDRCIKTCLKQDSSQHLNHSTSNLDSSFFVETKCKLHQPAFLLRSMRKIVSSVVFAGIIGTNWQRQLPQTVSVC